MWLVCDVGNSAIKCALFEGEHLERTFRLPHDQNAVTSGLLDVLERVSIERAGIASVVPHSRQILEDILRDRKIPLTVVHPSMPLPFDVAYTTPETLGVDRLAAAAAAWGMFGRDASGRPRSVIALDAGSALTLEIIRRDAVYLGGVIAPGPGLSQRALSRGTAQLPAVPLKVPDGVIGRSTMHAIQSGIMFGFIESVRGLLRRIDGALGEPAFVVATGGWSELLLEHVPEIASAEPHLVLKGVRLLMEGDGTPSPS